MSDAATRGRKPNDQQLTSGATVRDIIRDRERRTTTMVRARSARGRKTRDPARLIQLEFARGDLTDFATNLRACARSTTDDTARHFLLTAAVKIDFALTFPGDLVKVEGKADSWRRLALESLRFRSGKVGQSLIRLVHLADQRADRAREARAKAENDAALKKSADALRERERLEAKP